MPLATSLSKTSGSLAAMIKSLVPPMLWHQIYRRLIVGRIPDAELYKPFYCPWLSPQFLSIHRDISPYTLVSPERAWTIHNMVAQALVLEGDVMEAGVYKGGTARLLKRSVSSVPGRRLFLFDSFEGMEKVNKGSDRHREGDFADTSLDRVSDVVGTESFVFYRKGWIPETFEGLETEVFCFAHIDLDLYQGIFDCLHFLYPRMPPGGVIVFDDYGFPSCPGARAAVDEFFSQ